METPAIRGRVLGLGFGINFAFVGHFSSRLVLSCSWSILYILWVIWDRYLLVNRLWTLCNYLLDWLESIGLFQKVYSALSYARENVIANVSLCNIVWTTRPPILLSCTLDSQPTPAYNTPCRLRLTFISLHSDLWSCDTALLDCINDTNCDVSWCTLCLSFLLTLHPSVQVLEGPVHHRCYAKPPMTPKFGSRDPFEWTHL